MRGKPSRMPSKCVFVAPRSTRSRTTASDANQTRLGHRRHSVAQTHPNQPVSVGISRHSMTVNLACQTHFCASFSSYVSYLRSERSQVRILPGASFTNRLPARFPPSVPRHVPPAPSPRHDGGCSSFAPRWASHHSALGCLAPCRSGRANTTPRGRVGSGRPPAPSTGTSLGRGHHRIARTEQKSGAF